jgi:glycosyltransferase involved in cell wall biosynthesis
MKNLTIIIPVRNMAGKLKPLEESITAALCAGIQVSVIHDKADDQTEIELRRFFAHQDHSQMSLLTGVYNSPGGARNSGILGVKTDWVTFWDSDDRPEVENLVQLYELVEQSSADVGIGDYTEINLSYQSSSRHYRNESQELNSLALAPGIWRMIFRTKLVVESPFQSLLLAEDQIMLSDLQITKRKIVFLNAVVYNYLSGNPESLTGQSRKTGDLVESISHILLNIENQASKNQREFDWIMLAKQALTLLKYGNSRGRFFAVRRLLHFLLIAPIRARRTILRHLVGRGRLDG